MAAFPPETSGTADALYVGFGPRESDATRITTLGPFIAQHSGVWSPPSCPVCDSAHALRTRYWTALCERAQRRAHRGILLYAQIIFRQLLAWPWPDWLGVREPRTLQSQLTTAPRRHFFRQSRPSSYQRRRREWRPRGRRGRA